jgi:hypothetical protein
LAHRDLKRGAVRLQIKSYDYKYRRRGGAVKAELDQLERGPTAEPRRQRPIGDRFDGAHRETDQSDQSVSPYAAPDMRTFFSGRSELLILWLPWTKIRRCQTGGFEVSGGFAEAASRPGFIPRQNSFPKSPSFFVGNERSATTIAQLPLGLVKAQAVLR